MKKFNKFTDGGFRVLLTWKTRIIGSFFTLKDGKDYKLCVVCKGNSPCFTLHL